MTAIIEIECKTAKDLEMHLHDIISTIKIRSREDPDYEFEIGTFFHANAPFGTHEVTIIHAKS